MHELAEVQGSVGAQAKEHEEHNAHGGARAAVPPPAVHIKTLAPSQPLDEAEAKPHHLRIAHHVAVNDREVHEVQVLRLDKVLARLAPRAHARHGLALQEVVGIYDVGPKRQTRAPHGLGRVVLVLALQAHEGGDAEAQNGAQDVVVLAVVVVRGVGADQQPAGQHPVALFRGTEVRVAVLVDRLDRL